MPIFIHRCSSATLILLALTAACSGGDGGDATTTPGSGSSTAGSTSTTSPTSTSETSSSATSTGDPSTSATSTGDAPTSDTLDPSTGGTPTTGADTGAVCTGPTLAARWVVPGSDRCAGVGIDDSGAVTLVNTITFGQDFHATLVRIVDGEVAWTVDHAPKYAYVQPNGLAVRGDGVVIVVGYSDDMYDDTIGDVAWTAVYDATGALLFDHVDETVLNPDACVGTPCVYGENRAAVVTPGGEFLVGGEKWLHNGPDYTFNSYGVLRRYDLEKELAVTMFDMPASATDTDVTRSLAVRGDGSVVMFGETEPSPFNLDWWFARLASDGSFQDIHTFSAGKQDYAGGVVARDDGSIVFSGLGSDELVASLDADLKPIWQTPAGEYGPLALGHDDAVFAVLDDFRVVEKLSAAGEPMWADDPCLEGEHATALALSTDRTRLVVCRELDDEQVVEIYEDL